jgi:hypothetical protein
MFTNAVKFSHFPVFSKAYSAKVMPLMSSTSGRMDLTQSEGSSFGREAGAVAVTRLRNFREEDFRKMFRNEPKVRYKVDILENSKVLPLNKN